MDFFIGKQLLKDFVLPPTGLLALALLGLALLHFSRLRRAGTVLCTLALAALWLLATPFIADALERASQHYPALDLDHVPRADAIVILAGGVRLAAPEYGRAAPNFATLQRVSFGARVARAIRLPVLVSGSREEVAAMSDFLQRDFGVDVQWLESHSRDTRENAQMSAVILKNAQVGTVVLVTSAEHMSRAVAEFRAAGFAVIPAPTGLWSQHEFGLRRWMPSADALWRARGALYEDLGYVVLALRAH